MSQANPSPKNAKGKALARNDGLGGVVVAGPKAPKMQPNFRLVSRQSEFCREAMRIVNRTNFPLSNFMVGNIEDQRDG